MKLVEFMIPYNEICFVLPDTDLEKLAALLLVKQIGSILVKEEFGNQPIGIITSYDIIEAYLSKINPSELTARHIMTKNLEYCDENDTREKIANEMIKLGYHHMLIWNNKKELVGLVSAYDIAKDIALDSKEKMPWLKNLFRLSRRKRKSDKEGGEEEKKEENKERVAEKNKEIDAPLDPNRVSEKAREKILRNQQEFPQTLQEKYPDKQDVGSSERQWSERQPDVSSTDKGWSERQPDVSSTKGWSEKQQDVGSSSSQNRPQSQPTEPRKEEISESQNPHHPDVRGENVPFEETEKKIPRDDVTEKRTQAPVEEKESVSMKENVQ
jgi:CBS domain-containing protein